MLFGIYGMLRGTVHNCVVNMDMVPVFSSHTVTCDHKSISISGSYSCLIQKYVHCKGTTLTGSD